MDLVWRAITAVHQFVINQLSSTRNRIRAAAQRLWRCSRRASVSLLVKSRKRGLVREVFASESRLLDPIFGNAAPHEEAALLVLRLLRIAYSDIRFYFFFAEPFLVGADFETGGTRIFFFFLAPMTSIPLVPIVVSGSETV